MNGQALQFHQLRHGNHFQQINMVLASKKYQMQKRENCQPTAANFTFHNINKIRVDKINKSRRKNFIKEKSEDKKMRFDGTQILMNSNQIVIKITLPIHSMQFLTILAETNKKYPTFAVK